MSITITGNVTDASGVALQNALLTLKPVVSTLAAVQSTFSDASGNYSFTITTNGTYQLTVTSNGIVYRNPKLIVATGSAITNLNFQAVAQSSSNSGTSPY